MKCENTKFSGKFKIEIQLDIISQTSSEHLFFNLVISNSRKVENKYLFYFWY